MKNLLYNRYLLSALAAVTCVIGCDSVSDRLETASRLVKERPDSSYAILRNIDYSDLEADSLKAKYILTKARANIGVGRSLVTDTSLGDAADYYISAGDTSRWVIASLLLSGYDFTKGDPQGALQRLEGIVSKVSNPLLLWDTRVNMLQIAIAGGEYERAYGCADWLLRHTDVPQQKLKYATAKGATLYLRGNYSDALAVFDSIISTGVVAEVPQEVSREFYCEYADILDAAGHPATAIAIMDSIYGDGTAVRQDERIGHLVSLAQFYADSGNTTRAMELLDSINHDATQSVFEIYAGICMLKTALLFKDTGRFPADLMHKVTKNIQRNYWIAQYDRQTAIESVIELNDDIYELRLQRERLWLFVACIALLLVVCGISVYFILSRRRQRMIEAEERIDTLEHMLKDMEKAGDEKSCTSDSDKLRAALLRQLGIFKTFAGTPTPQSRDALRKISSAGKDGVSIESLVDWPEFYSMIDNLYDGFHSKLVMKYPGIFNDKEQQIIVLLKAGFSTKEIGVLTEQTSATIYTRKSVIRKKTSTPENGDPIATVESQIKGI